MKKKNLFLYILIIAISFSITTNVYAAYCVSGDGEHAIPANTENDCKSQHGTWHDEKYDKLETKEPEKKSDGNTEIDLSCSNPDVAEAVNFAKNIYNFVRVMIPVILVIMGSIDFAKATMASKEEDMAKNRKKFITRLLLAAGAFLLLSIFELITNILVAAGVAEADSWLACW